MARFLSARAFTRMQSTRPSLLAAKDTFVGRHNGPRASDVKEMCGVIGVENVEELISKTVPASIRSAERMDFGKYTEGMGESDMLAHLKEMAGRNVVAKSHIGMGYYDTKVPAVILRNLLENPAWYTSYTPYQPEVAQGRMESLLNFQTMVSDLTGMALCNASLLDESTAAAEALTMTMSLSKIKKAKTWFVDTGCHPQTIELVKTRAEGLGVTVIVGDHATADIPADCCGALVQYPTSNGTIEDYSSFADKLHDQGAKLAMATDLLALTLIKPPSEMGADMVVGSSQRFGVPLGFGGPHAGFLSTSEEYARKMPGRIIGVSIDAQGKPAYRLTMQTREQHIRRDKATSNVCTAQALLANTAAMYACYHGPEGLKEIARHCHSAAVMLGTGLSQMGFSTPVASSFFDTVKVSTAAGQAAEIVAAGHARHINLRLIDDSTIGVAMDETTTVADVQNLFEVFALGKEVPVCAEKMAGEGSSALSLDFTADFVRESEFMLHPIFNMYHSETDLMRYMFTLQSKDISLCNSMIALGSCTMKLNAAAEMIPITWPEFGQIHPFAPLSQTEGYMEMINSLEDTLCELTGFHTVSLQPNSGAQGEYAGLRAIRSYHESNGHTDRNVCLIPVSAHGTNPASAAMCGMKVVAIQCDKDGNIDVADLKAKSEKHADKLGALMVTYPSTHGVFEESIKEVCEIIHSNGGQVYMDGANMNAQVGLCSPGAIGADVCHLNLHKTFCIPHGGGGPGVGPIGVVEHLAPFLPSHPVHTPNPGREGGDERGFGVVCGAPWGSASILPISWMYCHMMGADGLKQASEMAILNANYMAKRLENHFDVLYVGKNGTVAHEFILDMRPFKASCGVTEVDVAKRMADYGFHAPTMSWPVAGTMMVEPTESESMVELDRFCDAMISIREEIKEIEAGVVPKDNNLLKHAPHTLDVVSGDSWERPYSRSSAAFPMPHLKGAKVWPTVSRVNDVHGDRNLICTCPPLSAYEEDEVELEAAAGAK